MSNARNALGMKFQVGSSDTVSEVGAASDSFLDVSEMIDIKPPSIAPQLNETTTHNNTTGYPEWTPSAIKNLEPFTVKVNLREDDVSHNTSSPRGLMYLLNNTVKRNVRVKYPNDNWVMSMGAYVTKVDFETDKKNVRMATFTIQPTDYYTVV